MKTKDEVKKENTSVKKILLNVGSIAILILALLLMYARIYLNAHTPSQVVCGFLLGLIGTFTPTLILTYA